MCKEFFNSFFTQISEDLLKNEMKNTIEQQYIFEMDKSEKCLKCGMAID